MPETRTLRSRFGDLKVSARLCADAERDRLRLREVHRAWDNRQERHASRHR